MNLMLETIPLQCPYCWEMIDILVDTSVLSQEYIEDCSVCCKPIQIRVEIGADGNPSVTAAHENE